MFISLSKVLGKVGGLRIGAGMRITNKNAWWMGLIISMVYLFKFMLYLLVLGGWMLYALGWLAVKGVKLLYSAIKKSCDKKAGGDSGKKPLAITSAIVAGVVATGGVIGGVTSANNDNKDVTTEAAVFEKNTQNEDVINLFEDESDTEETTAEESTTEETTTEKITTTQKETTTEKPTTTKKETTTKKATTAKKTTTTQATQNNSRTVYRTPSGKRYHFDPECGGRNSYSVSLDDAKASGLTGCLKCADS